MPFLAQRYRVRRLLPHVFCRRGRPAIAAGAVLLAAPASAEPFVTLDRASTGSHLDSFAGLTLLEGDNAPTGLRFDLRGQWTNRDGVGGYTTLPLSLRIGNNNNDAALGNLEVGGLYATRSLVVRVGLVLDTGDDSFEGSQTRVFNVLGRLTDVVSALSGASWLRFSVSPLFERGALYARFDGGFDIPLGEETADLSGLARFNGALGARLGSLALAGEFVTVGTLDGNSSGNRWVHSFALSVTGRGSGTQPYGAIVWPLDSDRGARAATIVAGARWPL